MPSLQLSAEWSGDCSSSSVRAEDGLDIVGDHITSGVFRTAIRFDVSSLPPLAVVSQIDLSVESQGDATSATFTLGPFNGDGQGDAETTSPASARFDACDVSSDNYVTGDTSLQTAGVKTFTDLGAQAVSDLHSARLAGTKFNLAFMCDDEVTNDSDQRLMEYTDATNPPKITITYTVPAITLRHHFEEDMSTAGRIGGAVSTTRAGSNAPYIDSAGIVQLASANATRFDHTYCGVGVPFTFDNDVQGFVADNGSLTWNAGGTVTFEVTATDGRLRTHPYIDLNGGECRFVSIRLRLLEEYASAWDGKVFYVTPTRPGDSGSFYKAIPEPEWVLNEWVTLVMDMHDLTAGGDEWKDEDTIRRVRFDFAHDDGKWEIDWVLISDVTEFNTPLGLVCDGDYDNVIEDSDDYEGAKWLNIWGGGVAVTPNATTAPDGTATATKIETVDSSGDALDYRQFNATVGGEIVIKQWMKRNDNEYFRLGVYSIPESAWMKFVTFRWREKRPVFNDETGIKTLDELRFIAFPDDWWLIQFKIAASATAANHLYIIWPEPQAAFPKSSYVWRTMITDGDAAGLPIKTVAATSSVAADDNNVNDVTFLDAAATAKGAIFARYRLRHDGHDRCVAHLDDGTTDDYVAIEINSADAIFAECDNSGASGGSVTDAGDVFAPVDNIALVSWSDLNLQFGSNGVLGTPSATPDFPLNDNMTALLLGRLVGDIDYLFGHLRELVGFDGNLSPEAMVAMMDPAFFTSVEIQQALQSMTAASTTVSPHLVIADASHALDVDSPALTQAAMIGVADVAQSMTVDAVALLQAHLLAVQESLQSSSAENVDLTQANVIVIQGASHALDVDSPALTQATMISVDDVEQSMTVDAVALIQAHLLAIQSALQSSSVDNIDLTQAHVLAVQEALMTITADSPVLSVAINLAVADALLSITVDTPALLQDHILSVSGALLSQAAENITLETEGAFNLIVQGALLSASVDNVALAQAHVLSVADALQSLLADEPILSTATILQIDDATLTSEIDPVALTQKQILTTQGAVLQMSAEGVVFSPILQVSDALMTMLVDAISIGKARGKVDAIFAVDSESGINRSIFIVERS